MEHPPEDVESKIDPEITEVVGKLEQCLIDLYKKDAYSLVNGSIKHIKLAVEMLKSVDITYHSIAMNFKKYSYPTYEEARSKVLEGEITYYVSTLRSYFNITIPNGRYFLNELEDNGIKDIKQVYLTTDPQKLVLLCSGDFMKLHRRLHEFFNSRNMEVKLEVFGENPTNVRVDVGGTFGENQRLFSEFTTFLRDCREYEIEDIMEMLKPLKGTDEMQSWFDVRPINGVDCTDNKAVIKAFIAAMSCPTNIVYVDRSKHTTINAINAINNSTIGGNVGDTGCNFSTRHVDHRVRITQQYVEFNDPCGERSTPYYKRYRKYMNKQSITPLRQDVVNDIMDSMGYDNSTTKREPKVWRKKRKQ